MSSRCELDTDGCDLRFACEFANYHFLQNWISKLRNFDCANFFNHVLYSSTRSRHRYRCRPASRAIGRRWTWTLSAPGRFLNCSPPTPTTLSSSGRGRGRRRSHARSCCDLFASLRSEVKGQRSKVRGDGVLVVLRLKVKLIN